MFVRSLLVAMLLAAPAASAQAEMGTIKGVVVDVTCQSVTLWSDGTIELESCEDDHFHLTFMVATPPTGVDADGDGENDVEAGLSAQATAGEAADCERATAPGCEDPCEGDDGAAAGDVSYRGRRINIDLVDADIHNINEEGDCMGASVSVGGYSEGPVVVDDDDD